MTPTCPQCKRAIPSEEINVAKDVAYCRPCNVAHALSALTHGPELEANVDLRHPPPGAWYRHDGWGTVIGATHRSIGGALGALAISLFWNGIVSVFVLLALSATLKHCGVLLPEWFPAPVMNDSPMSVGMTIFLWIFLTPFIVIGLIMIGAFLSCLAGRTEVRVRNDEGAVYTGIGPLSYWQRFDASTIKGVRLDDKQWHDSEGARQQKTHILIETRAGKQIKFGSMLSAERRRFVAAALRKTLTP